MIFFTVLVLGLVGPSQPQVTFVDDNANTAGLVFQSTFGEDTRQRIQQTNQFPFSAIGQLQNGCTGTIISPRHVLTAAHCIRDPVRVQRIFDLQFIPGKNADVEPFGVFDWEAAVVPANWTLELGLDTYRRFDYGIVTLSENVPLELGTMAFENGLDCNRSLYVLNVAGYPDDKTPKGSQWVSICRGTNIPCTSLDYSHQCDTFNGMSGSPMWVFRPEDTEQHVIIGVHSAGNVEAQENYGVTLNENVVRTMQRWINGEFNEEDQRINKPLSINTVGVADEDCSTDPLQLVETYKLGICLNSMRQFPLLYQSTDPCAWTRTAEAVPELQFDEVLQALAEEHAQHNAETLNATSKTLSNGKLPETRLFEQGYQWASGTLLTTIQAGPGRGGVWGVSSGWMCVPARATNARSCSFDRLGVGVSFSTTDGNYYIVMYQACSKEGGCSCS